MPAFTRRARRAIFGAVVSCIPMNTSALPTPIMRTVETSDSSASDGHMIAIDAGRTETYLLSARHPLPRAVT